MKNSTDRDKFLFNVTLNHLIKSDPAWNRTKLLTYLRHERLKAKSLIPKQNQCILPDYDDKKLIQGKSKRSIIGKKLVNYFKNGYINSLMNLLMHVTEFHDYFYNISPKSKFLFYQIYNFIVLYDDERANFFCPDAIMRTIIENYHYMQNEYKENPKMEQDPIDIFYKIIELITKETNDKTLFNLFSIQFEEKKQCSSGGYHTIGKKELLCYSILSSVKENGIRENFLNQILINDNIPECSCGIPLMAPPSTHDFIIGVSNYFLLDIFPDPNYQGEQHESINLEINILGQRFKLLGAILYEPAINHYICTIYKDDYLIILDDTQITENHDKNKIMEIISTNTRSLLYKKI